MPRTWRAAQVVAAARSPAIYGRREVAIRANGLDTPWGTRRYRCGRRFGVPTPSYCPRSRAPPWFQESRGDHVGQRRSGRPNDLVYDGNPARHPPRRGDRRAPARGIDCLIMGTSDLDEGSACRAHGARTPADGDQSWAMPSGRTGPRASASSTGCISILEDDEGLEALRVNKALEFGFDGKTLIHPQARSPPLTTFFAPGRARRSRRPTPSSPHSRTHRRSGKGVVVVDGQLIENLHVEGAQRLIATRRRDRRARGGERLTRSHCLRCSGFAR